MRSSPAASPAQRSGSSFYISETTVKTHVTHIFEKLSLRDRVRAVVPAYQPGLVEAGIAI